MRQISYFMESHPEIISADFCYNNFGDEGLKYFSHLYFGCDNNLVNLNIMHCDITAVGMKYLSSSDHLRLKICRLNGNKIGALVIFVLRFILFVRQSCLKKYSFSNKRQDSQSRCYYVLIKNGESIVITNNSGFVYVCVVGVTIDELEASGPLTTNEQI